MPAMPMAFAATTPGPETCRNFRREMRAILHPPRLPAFEASLLSTVGSTTDRRKAQADRRGRRRLHEIDAGREQPRVSERKCPSRTAPRRSSPPGLHPHPWRGALPEDIAAEAVEAGGAAAGAQTVLAGGLDEAAALDHAAEVLLVEMRAEHRLDRPLQLEQGELVRHQLEHDGAALHRAPQLADSARQHPGMVAQQLGHRP